MREDVASLSQKQMKTLDSVNKSVCLLEMDRCDSLPPGRWQGSEKELKGYPAYV